MSEQARGRAEVAIDQLVAMVEGWIPGFEGAIEGAPSEHIEALEAELGPLPAGQYAFLRRMGADHGGLNSYGDDVIDFGAEAMLQYAKDPLLHPDRSQFTVAGAAAPGVEGLFFDRRNERDGRGQGGNGGAPALVRLATGMGGPVVIPEHRSFIDMLFGFAFLEKRLPSLAHELWLRSPGTRRPAFGHGPPGTWRDQCAWMCGQLGFVLVEQGPSWWVCAEREDAALALYEAPGYAPDVRIAAGDRLELMRLAEVLMDNLDLTLVPGSLRGP